MSVYESEAWQREQMLKHAIKQTELLERIVVLLEKLTDDGGDTQEIDTDRIERIARAVSAIEIGGGS